MVEKKTMKRRIDRLREENVELRSVLRDILKEATHEGPDEPTEDEMICALETIHSYAKVSLTSFSSRSHSHDCMTKFLLSGDPNCPACGKP